MKKRTKNVDVYEKKTNGLIRFNSNAANSKPFPIKESQKFSYKLLRFKQNKYTSRTKVAETTPITLDE